MIYIYILLYNIDMLLYRFFIIYIYILTSKRLSFLAEHLTLTVPIPDFNMDILSLSRRKFILLDTFLFEGSNVEFTLW